MSKIEVLDSISFSEEIGLPNGWCESLVLRIAGSSKYIFQKVTVKIENDLIYSYFKREYKTRKDLIELFKNIRETHILPDTERTDFSLGYSIDREELREARREYNNTPNKSS